MCQEKFRIWKKSICCKIFIEKKSLRQKRVSEKNSKFRKIAVKYLVGEISRGKYLVSKIQNAEKYFEKKLRVLGNFIEIVKIVPVQNRKCSGKIA